MLLPITAVQQRQRDNLLAAAAFLASGGADFVVAYADPDDLDDRLLPLRDVRIESPRTGTRIVCEVHLGADPAEVALDIASTWGVTTHRTVQLPAPLARLVRELVDDDQAAQRPRSSG